MPNFSDTHATEPQAEPQAEPHQHDADGHEPVDATQPPAIEPKASDATVIGTFIVPTDDFIALPPHPAQRDHLLRSQDPTLRAHLANPIDVHRNVTAIARLCDGMTVEQMEGEFVRSARDALLRFCVKADGHTRSHLWETSQIPAPRSLRVTVVACSTDEDEMRVYDSFDSKSAVKTTANELQSLMRFLSMTPQNPLVQSGQFRVALSLAHHLLAGEIGTSFPRSLASSRISAAMTEAERIEAMHPVLPILRAWRGPILALDELLVDADALPTRQGYLAAYLALLRRDEDENRTDGRRFLAELVQNPGSTVDGQADAIAYLRRMPDWLKANQPDLGSSEKLQVEAAVVFSAFNAWMASDTFAENASPMRQRKVAVTFYTPRKDEEDARRAAEARERRAEQIRRERAATKAAKGTKSAPAAALI